MRTCKLEEIAVGEVVYARYPNGEMGTCTVDDITGRTLRLRSNWGEKDWTFEMRLETDYTNSIKKFIDGWDTMENIK